MKSHGSETDEVTIRLYREGEDEPAYSTTVTGCNAEYSIPNVLSGDYTARFTKPNHPTVENFFSVIDEPVTVDAELPIAGDVNNDGYVNTIDAAMVYAYYNGKIELSDFQQLMANVCGSGADTLAAAVIYAFYNGKLTRFPG